MYTVLVVDDDSCSLLVARACLKKWNYEVMAVKNAADALNLLRTRPCDLALLDVHMPGVDGFQLQHLINLEFNLPIIFVSGDDNAESMCKGLQNGAQRYIVKPLKEGDARDMFVYCEWWKKNKNTSIAATVTGISRSITFNNVIAENIAWSSGRTRKYTKALTGKNNKKLIWTRHLHTRFVEAILTLGHQKAVPKAILEVMNVKGVTREQVASHLQKFRKFLYRVLDGSTTIESSDWIDFKYSAPSGSRNPNLILLDQLRKQQVHGTAAGPILPLCGQHRAKVNIPTANVSSVSAPGYNTLPAFNGAAAQGIYGGSSGWGTNVMLMPNNFASSSTNVVVTQGVGNVTIPEASWISNGMMMPNNFASSSLNVALPGLGGANYLNTSSISSMNAMLMPSNSASSNVNAASQLGLGGATFQNVSPSMNNSAIFMPNNYASSFVNLTGQGLSSATAQNAGYNSNRERSVLNFDANQMGSYNQNTMVPQQDYNGVFIGGANNNMFSSPPSNSAPFDTNFYSKQSFSVGGQDSNIIFNGNQVGNVQHDPSTGISFAANTSAIDGQQLGSGQMTGLNLFNNNEITDPNLNQQGEDDDEFWQNVLDFADQADDSGGDGGWLDESGDGGWQL